jgi:hypothetical protein
MNALKNVLFFGLLLAVLCGIFLKLNRAPEPTLPPGLNGDTRPPTVTLPDQTGGSLSTTPSGQQLSSPPIFPPQSSAFSTPQAGGGGVAPPFQPATPAATPPVAGGSVDTRPLPPPPPAGPGAASPTEQQAAVGAPPPSPQPYDYPPGVQRPTGAGSPSAAAPPRDSFAQPPGSSALLSMETPTTVAPPRDSSALPPPPGHSASAEIEQTLQKVKRDVEAGQFDHALLNLSLLYGSPDLPASQAQEITKILDQMAAKVIYSREHLLENAYLVQAGDTLDGIADRYGVPALLLAKINGIRDPQDLSPGKSLKVLKGPFSAQISTDRAEMTLKLSGRYAGRFNVQLSSDLGHAQGLWWVREKHAQANVAGGATGMPWIELNNASGTIAIQAVNDARGATARDGGASHTILVKEQDMDDLVAILSAGSSVIIQR